MKNWILAALMAVSLSLTLAPTSADAKRLGGGKSSGMQRSNMPDSASGRAAPTGQQAAPAAAPTNGAAPAQPAAAPKRNWMGPLAGLAAGLGIAALMSHLGMGEAFGNIIMFALIAMVAVVAIRFVMSRMAGNKAKPSFGAGGLATAGAGAGAAGATGAAGWTGAAANPVMNRNATPADTTPLGVGGPSMNNVSNLSARPVGVPADFDSEGFERAAKMIFIRMQAANDTGDLNDLRGFTTPEMFASIKLDLQERGDAPQTTDVVKVDAHVLDVERAGERQVVSVRFFGQIREELNGPLNDFDEVWHLVRFGDAPNWTISGIQQR